MTVGFDERDVPWPKRGPKKQKGGSNRPSRRVVGMAIILVALPMSTMVGVIGFLVHGHLVD